MAVQEQTPQIEYVANGVTKSFPLTFDCEDQDHLIVTIDDNESSVGSWQLIDNSVVFRTAPAAGSTVTMQRNSPFERTTTYQTYNNSFRPEPVNKDLDRIWWKLQELGLADWLLSKRLDKEIQDRILADLALKADYILRDSKLKEDYISRDKVLEKDYIQRDVALKKYIDSMIALVTGDPSFTGITPDMIIDKNGATQQEINDTSVRTVESISDLLSIKDQLHGQVVFVKGYYKAINFALAQPYKGGGAFIFNEVSKTINDGFLTFNGWIRQFESNVYTPYMSGCKCDGKTDDTLNLDKMLYVLEQKEMQGIVQFTETLFVNSFSPRTGKKWEAYNYVIRLVSHVHFDIKGTIKLGSFYDNKDFYLLDGRGFLDIPEDKGLGLMLFYNIKIYGGGTIDGTGAGMMHTKNLKRLAIGTGNIIDFEICDLTFKGGRYQNTIWVHFLSLRGSIHNCVFLDQYPDGDACHDHSSIYTCGYDVDIYKNTFTQKSISGKLNSACIEIHNSKTTLRDNVGTGYRVFAYVALIDLPFEGQDPIRTDILIENNVATNMMQFFSIWSGFGGFNTHKKIGLVTVQENTFSCFTADDRKLSDFLAANPIPKQGVSNNTEFWNNLPSMFSFFFIEGSQHPNAPNTQKLLSGDFTRVVVHDNTVDLVRDGKNTNTIFYYPRYHNLEHNVELTDNKVKCNLILKLDDFDTLIKYYDFNGFKIAGNEFDYKYLSPFCMQGAVGSLQNIDWDIFLDSEYHDSEDKFQFRSALSCKNTAAKISSVKIKSGSTYGNITGMFIETSILSNGQKSNIHVECDMDITFTLYKNGSAYAQDQGLFSRISKATITRIKNKSQYSVGLNFNVSPILKVGTETMSALSTKHEATLSNESIIVDTTARVTFN